MKTKITKTVIVTALLIVCVCVFNVLKYSILEIYSSVDTQQVSSDASYYAIHTRTYIESLITIASIVVYSLICSMYYYIWKNK